MRIMAMVGDGHTLAEWRWCALSSGPLPCAVVLFKDGLFVRRIAAEQAEWAGNKDFKIVVLENADHSMTPPNMNRRESVDANAQTQFIWGRVPPEFTQTMLDWLLARVTVARKR